MSDAPFRHGFWDFRKFVSAILNTQVPAHKPKRPRVFIGPVLSSPKKQGSSATRNCQAIFFLKRPKSRDFLIENRVPSATEKAVLSNQYLVVSQKRRQNPLSPLAL